MNTISEILHKKSLKNKQAFIPFLTAGYPNIYKTIEALHILDRQGADIIELGIPYADALADGPIIQKSSKIALDQGVYIDQVLDILAQVKCSINAPIVIFTYYNPVLVKGIYNFILDIAQRGVKGLIVPDLPIEEIDYLLNICKLHNIELILFVAPTSSKQRISYILSKALGCIYLVSSTGVTGTRNVMNSKITDLSDYIKYTTEKRVMLGFGISSPEQVSQLSNWNIDGIVIGSAIINAIAEDYTLKVLSDFCISIKLVIK